MEAFAEKINRQRTSPRIFDYAYLMLRNNLMTFKRFVQLVNARAGERNKQPLRVLDVGCGFKPWRKFFNTDILYAGIDFSAKCSAADAVAAAEHIPFPAQSFDAIICSEMLEHSRHPESVIGELRRISKPGALLFISSPFFFPEHGAPYDFQRLTRYFYLDEFKNDQIVHLAEATSSFGTACVCMNLAIESSIFHIFVGFKHFIYTLLNLTGICADFLIKHLTQHFNPSTRGSFYYMPMGYSVILRIK